MRALVFAALASATLASAASAATIVQTVDPLNNGIADFATYPEKALPFNPLVGTLTDVTIELIGIIHPQVTHDLPPPGGPSATLKTKVELVPHNGIGTTFYNIDPIDTQIVPLTYNAGGIGFATGAPVAYDHTFDFSNAADLAAFQTGTPGVSAFQFDYGFLSHDNILGGSGSDLTTFNGKAIVTYSFSVPEPATLMTFAVGLLGLTWLRRRRV